MSDELVERLIDWPYQGETMAEEAAVLIKQLTAERDGLWTEMNNLVTFLESTGMSTRFLNSARAELARSRHD